MQIQRLYILDNRGGPSIQTGLSQKKDGFYICCKFWSMVPQFFISIHEKKKNTIPSATYH